MKFTDLFIRRPVLAVVVNVLILLGGYQAIQSLSVRQYPRSENASITITTVYIGASADLVRGFITTPLERAIAAADGIEYIQSQSSQNISTITARLKINYDATKALTEISSMVNQVRNDLPPEAEIPTISIETADSQIALAYLSFQSKVLEPNEVTDYLVRVVQPRLAGLAGVQRAEILGGRTFAMRVWLKPERMASLNISPNDVRRALAANNYLSALGQSKGALEQINLTANTDLKSVEEFEQLVVRESDGVIIRLRDIAEVQLGAESYDAKVRFSGQDATFMGVWPLPNANAIEVIERVRSELEVIKRGLPSGMEGEIAYDATKYISDAIKEVVRTLSETLLIVVVVIFLFLGTVRSVIIPVVAIPISLIGALFLMLIFGFTLNLLTLLAIVLSVGLVVDDAIVMVENIERHMREGKKPLRAAMAGARELIGPVIAMTVTMAAVYTPVGLQGGLTGALFREFAFTLAGAVMISGIVAVTLSPMMAGHLLSAKAEERWLPSHINRGFEWTRKKYSRLLDATLSVRPAIYIIWLVLSLLGVGMLVMAPKELAPEEDQGVLFGFLELPANATIEQIGLSAEAVNDGFFSVPETQHSFQISTPNFAFGGMVVKPWGERERHIDEIQVDVAAKLQMIPGVKAQVGKPAALPGGGQFPVEFVIGSTAHHDEIVGFAQQIQGRAMQSGNFAFLNVDTKIDQVQSEVIFDRQKVASLGLNLQQVGADVAAMIGGNYVNRFSIDGRSYKVIPQIKRSERLNPDQLEQIHVTGPNGELIPLSTIARIEQHVEPRSLNRFQQLNAVTISGIAIRPLDEALGYLEEQCAEILPDGYVVDYKGDSRQLRTEGNKFVPAFMLAVVIIFLVLAAQFNSFRDPLVIILGSVPLAIFGAAIFMLWKMPSPQVPYWTNGWTTTLNIYSQVGLITLVGIVSKNGILMVEFANHLQQRGLSKLAAVKQASLTRLRAIIMTSLATVFGHLPLVFVTGPGAEARNSIGIIVVAGMAIGTVCTLFVVPALYMLIARQHTPEEVLSFESELEQQPAAAPIQA